MSVKVQSQLQWQLQQVLPILAKPRVCTVGPTSDVRIPRSSSSMRFLSDEGEYNDVQNLHTTKVSPVAPIRWAFISFTPTATGYVH